MNKIFPDQIFVSQEEKGTPDEWLQVNKTADETASIGEKKRVGRYVLHEVLTVETKVIASTHSLPASGKRR
jgi:hypothetical protein